MQFAPVSLSVIESAMLRHLKRAALADGTGEVVAEFDARNGIEKINRTPAVCVATEAIGFSKVDESTIRWTPEIMLYVVFKNVSSAAGRRSGAYPILEGAVRLLALHRFGLDIEPLVPGVRAEELINSELEKRGLIGFKVPFTTEFDVSKYEAEQEAVKFLISGVRYYLQPDDGEHDAEDVISLE